MEIKNLFDCPAVTQEMKVEFFYHYNHEQAHSELEHCFDPKKRDVGNAFCGWKPKTELIIDAYPTSEPVGSLIEKALVSCNVTNPRRDTPSGGAKYFKRYVYDNRAKRMLPPQTLNWNRN